MLAFLTFLCQYDWNVVSLLPYVVVIKVRLFFFLWWQSHLWLLSHPWMTNKAAVLFVPPVFLDGQPESTSSTKVLRWSSSRVAYIISPAVMQSSMSVHDSIRLMVMWMPYISLFLFVSWFAWIANLQWIVLTLICVVFLHCTGVSVVLFFETYLIDLQHLSWILQPVVCGLWSCFPPGKAVGV